jgi:hypothetical protein
MTRLGRERTDDSATERPSETGIDRIVTLLPGVRAGAPKRNTLVLLAYLLGVLLVAGFLLGLL